MKKASIALLLVIILGLCFSCAICESGVDVFTYLEQFVKNWEYMRYKYADSDYDVDLPIMNAFYADEIWYDLYGVHRVSTPAGSIDFGDDFLIRSIDIDFYDLNKETSEQGQIFLKPIIATSVLEFNTAQTDLMPAQYGYGLSEHPDVIAASMDIWTAGEIGEQIAEAMQLVLDNGGEHKFYTGKDFDYSLYLLKSQEGSEYDVNKIILSLTRREGA